MVVNLPTRGQVQQARSTRRAGYYTPERRRQAALVEHLNNGHCGMRDLREHDIPEAKVIALGKAHSLRALRLWEAAGETWQALRMAREWDRPRLIGILGQQLRALGQELRRDLEADEWLADYDQRENKQHYNVDQDVRAATALVEGVALGKDDGPEPPGAA